MKLSKTKSQSIRKIAFVAVVLLLFFGVGVFAGNSKQIKTVNIKFSDNNEINVLTASETVEGLLKENHIILTEEETVVPSMDTKLKETDKIRIYNLNDTNQITELAYRGEELTLDEIMHLYDPIVEKYEKEVVEIPFETVVKGTSAEGAEDSILQAGVNGLKEVTYLKKYQGELEIERIEISSVIIQNPVNKIVQVKQQVTSRSSSVRTATGPVDVSGLQASSQGKSPIVRLMNTSAYCSCAICCGKETGITASGARATSYYTIAAGPSYPIGTVVQIPALSNYPNGGWFVVQDRGGAISNTKLDIYFDGHSQALGFGRKTLECYIYLP